MLAIISFTQEWLHLSPKDILLGILGTEELWTDAPAARSHTARNVIIAEQCQKFKTENTNILKTTM